MRVAAAASQQKYDALTDVFLSDIRTVFSRESRDQILIGVARAIERKRRAAKQMQSNSNERTVRKQN